MRASDASELSVAITRALNAFEHGAENLTTEQVDALKGLESDRQWLEDAARYFADRAAQGGFVIY